MKRILWILKNCARVCDITYWKYYVLMCEKFEGTK
jgi:hypothetical protein